MDQKGVYDLTECVENAKNDEFQTTNNCVSLYKEFCNQNGLLGCLSLKTMIYTAKHAAVEVELQSGVDKTSIKIIQKE